MRVAAHGRRGHGGRHPALPGAAIEFVDVVRDAAATRAVDHADFVVGRGEIVALVGPLGSGRTTALRLAATLLAPDHGTVRVVGRDPRNDVTGVRASLAWVPAGAPTFAAATVREVLRTLTAVHGIAPAKARRRTHELVHLLGLRDVLDVRGERLDQGARVRLGLAQALLHDPDVLVLDEPLEGLGPADRRLVGDLLRSHAAQGGSVLLSAADHTTVEGVAHRVLVIDAGRLVAAHDRHGSGRRRRCRIVALDRAALHRVLARGGVEWVDVSEVSEDGWGARAAVEVELADEREAVALLSTLVSVGVPVSSFGPPPHSAAAAASGEVSARPRPARKLGRGVRKAALAHADDGAPASGVGRGADTPPARRERPRWLP